MFFGDCSNNFNVVQVDEGIEAMLCCWLQQLQEFGGPEVDKPDLLKGSVGSLKGLGAAKGPSSNGSLAKNNYIVDHRIRYNVRI
jgi:guanylate cyclase 2F